MLKRLYVHNFRCFENFELAFDATAPFALLIGKNGAGKSTVASSLRLFQTIGRGTNRVSQLLQPRDFSQARTEQSHAI